MQKHTKGWEGGPKCSITNSYNPADYVLIIMPRMIDTKFKAKFPFHYFPLMWNSMNNNTLSITNRNQYKRAVREWPFAYLK